MTLVKLLELATNTITVTWAILGSWILGARSRGHRAPAPVRAAFSELRVLFLPAALANSFLNVALGHDTAWVGLLIDVAAWLLLRGLDDDDRRKRRRRKFAEKVAVKGGRLVVAPAGAR